MTTKSSNRDAEKSIYFTFELYLDSLYRSFGSDCDLKDILQEQDRPMAISPVHDRDLYIGTEAFDKDKAEQFASLERIKDRISPERYERYMKVAEGYGSKLTPYRSEYHRVIYISKEPVTTQAVRNEFEKLLDSETVIDNVEIISSGVRDAYDYLTHGTIDSKVQEENIYNKDDILIINNFDVDKYESKFIRSREKALKEREEKRPKNNIPDVVSDYGASKNYQPNQTSKQNNDIGLGY